jgi:transposase
MIWGAIGYDFRSSLITMHAEPGCRGISQKAYYNQVLGGPLAVIYSREKLFDPCTFVVEDNAPIHGKKKKGAICNILREELDIYSIPWPPSSPDLNPIEWVWRYIKQRIRKYRPYGGWAIGDLKQMVYTIWNRMSPRVYRKVIREMPERIQEVIRREGGATLY